MASDGDCAFRSRRPNRFRSTALAGNTRLPKGIRRRPGEPTDNLRKPDYVGQASRRYRLPVRRTRFLSPPTSAAIRGTNHYLPLITYCLLLTAHHSPFHGSRGQTCNDMFLRREIESNRRDHCQSDERQDSAPVGAILSLKLHNSQWPGIKAVGINCDER